MNAQTAPPTDFLAALFPDSAGFVELHVLPSATMRKLVVWAWARIRALEIRVP